MRGAGEGSLVMLLETAGGGAAAPAEPHVDRDQGGALTLRALFGPRWRMLIIGAGQLSRALAQQGHYVACLSRSGSTWMFKQSLTDPATFYGSSVAVDGDAALAQAAGAVLVDLDERRVLQRMVFPDVLDEAAVPR